MELTFSLLTMHGKKCIFVFIDHFTNNLHSLSNYIQCIAPQEGKFLFGFMVLLSPTSVMEIAISCMALGNCYAIICMLI